MREEGADWTTLPMSDRGEGWYRAVLSDVVAPLEYRVVAGKALSETYRVGVIVPPTLEALRVTLYFPEYSGFGSKVLEENQGDITALIGTRVQIEGTSAAALRSALLDFGGGENVPMEVEGAQFRGEFFVQKSGRYALRLESVEGLRDPDPPRYTLIAIADEPPEVRLLQPERETVLNDSMRVPLLVEVVDDFGVADLTLLYRWTNGPGEEQVLLRRFDPPIPLERVGHSWDLSHLDLFPNDVVEYRFRVRDNDTVSGPKEAFSPTYLLRFPSMVELFDHAGFKPKHPGGAVRGDHPSPR
ncbi:MAG: hypothetical protein KatS3mg115_1881 [Candidatus Poribacteria bacterium]|nr:MAG: hypothetical protein KatS3mg115_1881 [Candidatus Poribacteria bacterium]